MRRPNLDAVRSSQQHGPLCHTIIQVWHSRIVQRDSCLEHRHLSSMLQLFLVFGSVLILLECSPPTTISESSTLMPAVHLTQSATPVFEIWTVDYNFMSYFHSHGSPTTCFSYNSGPFSLFAISVQIQAVEPKMRRRCVIPI